MDDCHFGQEKKKHHKIDQKNIGESEERLGERFFVCLFVCSLVVVAGGRVTVGGRRGRMCLCSVVVVVVATALLQSCINQQHDQTFPLL
jgi:hypothetical protein